MLASDLTLAEIRNLRARQAKADSLGRSRAFDGLFGLVTLDEFASYAASVPVDGGGKRWDDSSSSISSPSPSSSALPRRVVGVHVEAKHPTWHSETLPRCARDPAAMVEDVAGVLKRHGFATLSSPPPPPPSSSSSPSSRRGSFARDPSWLRAPTFLQCFEPGALSEATRRGRVAAPMVQLVDDAAAAVPGGWGVRGGGGKGREDKNNGNSGNTNVTFADLLSDEGLRRVAEFAHAIGPSVPAVLDKKKKGAVVGENENVSSSSFSSLAPRAKRHGLALHAWTLRDDKINLEEFARAKEGGALREAEAVLRLAEAAFGDFPATLVVAEERARKGEEQEEERDRASSEKK